MRARRSQDGFTLLELLVVVAIIAVLATLILGGLASARRRTQIAVARNNIAAIKAALQMYETDTGRYPCRANHATQTGANLFLNDITWVWASLHNRRTLQYGGGPNSPYLDWKPEQIAHVDYNAMTSKGTSFGATQDPGMAGGGGASNTLLYETAGEALQPDEFDQVNGNDATFFSSNWNSLKADGNRALCFTDPWGNPYWYIEWASVPQTAKDNIGNSVTITSNFGGTGGEQHILHPHDPSKFDIFCFGPNGVNEGGEGDDVTAWSTTTKR